MTVVNDLKAPAEKLPLTTRKNIRDEYESKKSDYEQQLQTLLGETWTIETSPNLIYQYADDSWRPRLGEVIKWYTEGFIYNLERFTSDYGSDGVQEINSACFNHRLILLPQTKTQFTYGGMVVVDGVLNLVFSQDSFASSVNDISMDFAQTLKNAPAPSGGSSSALSIIARQSVRTGYDPEVEGVRSAVANLVAMPDIKFNPNFEANAVLVADAKKAHPDRIRDDWERNLGEWTLAYYRGLQEVLEREKFEKDDMQQEAFQEAISKGEVCVQIVPKWEKSDDNAYNKPKVDGGVLFLQTTPENWGSNVYEAAVGLTDLL